MSEIIIGDIQLNCDGNTLTFTCDDEQDMAISLDEAGVRELIGFATSLTGSEFNQRVSFRIPLWNSCGLSVQIRKDKFERLVTPTNISLTGIFVELRSDDWLEMAMDDELEVILDFDGEIQSCRGVVRRCELNGYGVFFPESMKEEQLDPPQKITRIVMELQRRSMVRHAQRVRGI